MTKLVLASLLILFSAPLSAKAQSHEILIDLDDDVSEIQVKALAARYDLELKLNSKESLNERMYVADVAPSKQDELLARLKKEPLVEDAELNQEISLHPPPAPADALPMPKLTPSPAVTDPPNDPMWPKQWSFQMIGLPEAWSLSQGAGVVVAVIDTGVAYEDRGAFKQIEDLKDTRFVPGYNFVEDTPYANDDHGHGSHVAGTIAQSTNNQLGVAGIAPKAAIMPLKVLSQAGRGTTGDISDAIRFAADEGAHVINLSLGGGMRSRILERAVAYARNKGVLVVAAAGNSGRGRVEFPAAYPGALAISAVGPDRKRAPYSSYGKELTLAAPGGNKRLGGELGGILQNTITPKAVGRTQQYLAFQGTSMATPHVAGAAALLIGAGVTHPDRVIEILKDSAIDAGAPGWDSQYGYGILHLGDAAAIAESEVGGMPHLSLALLALIGLGVLFRRKLRFGGVGPSALLGVILGSSALGGYFGLGSLAVSLVGPWFGMSALWLSVLPVLLITLPLMPYVKLRGFLMGLAVGYSAYLAMGALLMPMDVNWMLGQASILDRGWLLLNALLLFTLAHAINRTRSTLV